MKLYVDMALLTGIAIWAVLEFAYKTDIGLLNALILFGLIVRFALVPPAGAANKEKCK